MGTLTARGETAFGTSVPEDKWDWPPELPPCQGFLLFFVMCHAICIFFNLACCGVSEKIAK